MNYQVYLDLTMMSCSSSISESAKKRGCLQSTMSRRVLSEEKRLGIGLYERKHRKLTKAGEIYVDYGKRLDKVLEKLVRYFDFPEGDWLMDYKAFSYVDSLSKTNNLTRSAENLYITQPALTQFFNHLESQLGCKLLNRARGRCTLTTGGEFYLDCAKQALEIAADCHTEIDNLIRKNAGRIRIALSRQTGSLLISRVMSAYLKEYPDVQVIITEADTFAARELLIRGQIDMAIMVVPNLHSGFLKYSLIYREELKLIMPSAWADRYPSPVKLSAMKNEPFIMQQDFTAFQHIAALAMEAENFHPEVVCRVNLFRAIAIMAASGCGAAFYPGHRIHDYGADCHVASLDPKVYYYLVYAVHEQTECGPHMVRLMELLEEEGARTSP